MTEKQIAEIFGALSHKIRLKIFKLIVDAGGEGVCPCVLAKKTGIMPNALTFHLNLLTRYGLISKTKRGKMNFYRARCKNVHTAVNYLLENCCKSGK